MGCRSVVTLAITSPAPVFLRGSQVRAWGLWGLGHDPVLIPRLRKYFLSYQAQSWGIFPHPQGCLEQVGEGGEGVHSLGNYFSLHVCILLRWQGSLDERPPLYHHRCSRSQTTKQEKALGVEQAGALRFHWATGRAKRIQIPNKRVQVLSV